MIELTINGAPYTDFVSASVTVSLESLANDFMFTASAVSDFPALRQGDAVTVLVEGIKELTGFIDEIAGRDAEGLHLLTYTGRDKTGDLIDSQIDVLGDIRPSNALTLKSLIETVVAHVGVGLEVVDTFNPPPFNEAEDILSPQVGDRAVSFLSVYARKRQALLSSNGDGNIVITQSQPTDSGAVVQRLQGAGDNNIIGQEWDITGSARFNKYVRRGQLDPRALNLSGCASASSVSGQSAEVVDDEVREGRQQVLVESESYSNAQLGNRAKWAKQLAKAAATRFRCSVAGHTLPGSTELWAVNTLVQVNSDTADISRKMLLSSVTFSEGEKQPTISSLEFVEKDVYTIDDKILAQRPAGDQNDAFKSLG